VPVKQFAGKLILQVPALRVPTHYAQTVDGSSSFEILRVLTEGTAAATGEQFFRSLARHAAQALHGEEVERRHILAVLEQTRWVIEGPEGAANILKLNPSTIRSRMKRLGIACSSTSAGG